MKKNYQRPSLKETKITLYNEISLNNSSQGTTGDEPATKLRGAWQVLGEDDEL